MPKKKSQDELVSQILERGTDTVYPDRKSFEQRLRAGRMTVYLGVDPSGADLHIGHTVALHKLRQFQQAGHKVILLIGDFTGQTGDPTDKTAARQPLTAAQVKANAKHYQKQAAKVLDFEGSNPVELRYNAKWLSRLTFAEVAELAGHFTVQQLLERDMFENRLKANKPISLREFLYPLMQGYDSVAMEVDVEVGGTDQTFNMLAGRKLLKEYKDKEKFVLTVPLLADRNGVKIGKTEGNAIAIAGQPADLYGQVMSLPDEVIGDAFAWCTSQPDAAVTAVRKLAKTKPRDAKMRLAHALVTEYRDAAAADQAEAHFRSVFQDKALPTQAEVWKPSKKTLHIRDALKEAGLVASSSEAQRKVAEGAVRLDGEPVALFGPITLRTGQILSVGKKNHRQIG